MSANQNWSWKFWYLYDADAIAAFLVLVAFTVKNVQWNANDNYSNSKSSITAEHLKEDRGMCFRNMP